MRVGKIAIIGQPNVGKSTLLNALVGERVAIVSDKPHTTRDRIAGILTRDDTQFVFLDTPGVDAPPAGDGSSTPRGDEGRGRTGPGGTTSPTDTPLRRYMDAQAEGALAEADLIVFLVRTPFKPRPDFAPGLHSRDRGLLAQVEAYGKPIFGVVSRADALGRGRVVPMLVKLAEEPRFAEVFAVSGRTGEGVGELLSAIAARLPEGELLFAPDDLSDKSVRFHVAEFVREQVFAQTHEELPYHAAVVVEAFEEKPAKRTDRQGPAVIHASIIVAREGHKPIVVGRRGERIREIGAAAREAIERFLDRPVFLQLFVKVERDWTHREGKVREAGYER